MSTSPRLAFLAADTTEAKEAAEALAARYGEAAPQDADVIVALGGDGFMLDALHRHRALSRPVYGMNRGTVGFLMNAYEEEGLIERLAEAERIVLNPLAMTATTRDGVTSEALAINEVSLLRQTRQASKLRIHIDGAVRLDELTCDGVLVATPAGSTAYNLSAHGPIVPLGSNVLALTPISAFRPRRWRGALLPATTEFGFEILDAVKRPVSAVADHHEVRDVAFVTVRSAPEVCLTLLFDPAHNLEDRILLEQFQP